jgi:hypothetical protein
LLGKCSAIELHPLLHFCMFSLPLYIIVLGVDSTPELVHNIWFCFTLNIKLYLE